MDFETPEETTDNSFAKEIVKSLVISTASSAGVITGFLMAGLAYNKFLELKDKRNAKKNQE